MARRHNAKGRSYEGVVPPGKTFYAMRHDIADSDAYRSLGGAAHKVYHLIRRRLDQRPMFFNNGLLALSAEDARRTLQIGKATAIRAFNELIEHGLIRRTKRGSFGDRMASTYALTDMRTVQGGAPTDDWKHWKNRTLVPSVVELGTEMDRHANY